MNILQELYDSEINYELSCFWDDGFDAWLGDDLNGFVAEAGTFKTINAAVEWLAEQAIRHYRNSAFARRMKDNPGANQVAL